MPLHIDGEALRLKRLRRGLSVPALAQRVGSAKQHIYRVEWGERNPSPQLYAKLLIELNCEAGDLLLDSDDPDQKPLLALTAELMRPEPAALWTCPNCGSTGNGGKNCANCQAGRPVHPGDAEAREVA